jgi:hypothetical protein
MIKKFSLKNVETPSQRTSRAVAEAEAQAASTGEGHRRLKPGKNKQVIFRVTDEKFAQLKRLAEFLSVGKSEPVTYTKTIETALDLLEAKIRGERQ